MGFLKQICAHRSIPTYFGSPRALLQGDMLPRIGDDSTKGRVGWLGLYSQLARLAGIWRDRYNCISMSIEHSHPTFDAEEPEAK
jgi:hypothetical protein